MTVLVSDYCKYGDINQYIETHHAKSQQYAQYRKRWKDNRSDLLFLLFEITSRCNLKCLMCAHSIGYPQTPLMSDEIFRAGLEGIREMDIPSVSVNQANEALLDKKIFERIRAVASLPNVVDIRMHTNAVLLNNDNSKRILESGLTRLLIGFDGFSPRVYEKMRCGAKYNLVLDNILRFLELKKKMGVIFPVVRVSLVRSSVNEHEIGLWLDFWKEKVDYLAVQEYLTPVLDDSKSDLIATSSLRAQIPYHLVSCEEPFERAIVRGNGDVILCCSPFAVTMPVGNIKKRSLKEIWRGEKANQLRTMFEENRWEEHPVCSRCLRISYQIEDKK